MADTTISNLGQIPSLVGNASLPISDGANTYRTTVTQLTSLNLPVIVATGGTESFITERGIRYKIHTFTTVGTTSLNITTAINNPTIELLIVGGGGGGGGDLAGGGGAGGVYYSKCITVTTGNKTVVVGAGGNGGGTTREVNTLGTNGGNSQFDIYSVSGGGRGGTYWAGVAAYNDGGNGGCGGGAGSYSTPFPLGGAGSNGTNNVLGNNGGSGTYGGWNHVCGGGGGAGGPGMDGQYNVPGRGGDGIMCDISGVAKYYAGGGGGSCYNGSVQYGLGGSGGGGRGGTVISAALSVGVAGLDGTGGGGGGGSYFGGPSGGGKGGSGIVIVRYPVY